VGVTSVSVVAVGAAGTTNSNNFAVGAGAQVSANLSVTPLETLYVEVGIGGGAGASLDGGSGGGESDLRTCSVSASGCPALGGPQDPRLIVAGGGGGAGAFGGGGAGGAGGVGSGSTCNAGGNGGNGQAGNTGFYGAGGQCSSGGGGGAASGAGGTAGSSGTAGVGGHGGAGASSFGGGGGGGGTSGTGNSGGGGGGSSYGPSDSVFSAASGPASVTISYSAPDALLTSSSALVFTSQDQGTVSPSQTVTVQNDGSDPQEYVLTSNGCLGPLAVGSSCSVGVSFVPQEQGARGAVLEIASNDPGSPVTVTLSGTGGSLPQGPTGATGATGATGPAGESGGNGKIELVTCTKIKKHEKTVKKCVTRLVTGTVKFTTMIRARRSRFRVELARGRTLYARGIVADGRVVMQAAHALTAGTYTLMLWSDSSAHGKVQRVPVTIASAALGA
jgi:hypothetical protein